MSVFLMCSTAALACIGVFDFNNFLTMPNFVKAIAFVVIFLALFLFVFFLINIKRSSSRKKKKIAEQPQGGLLAAASRLPPPSAAGIDETSRHNVIYEKNGVPYINSGMVNNDKSPENLDSNFVKLVESVKRSPNAACSATAG
ncbi:MAG: hypothetical protein LBU85_08065 [Treponema sp.]|jgi:hypothetical protein|nr:hypothetical protein [Treponema sp.]